MPTELLIFGFLYSSTLLVHHLHERITKRVSDPACKHRLGALVGVLGQPGVLDTIHHYAIHVVVYSGYVIGRH